MEIFRSINNFAAGGKTAVALGNFDGVHIGHAEIIKSAVKIAEKIGAEPACYTFSTHPKNLRADTAAGEAPAVRRITSEEEKAAILESLGIKKYLSVPFSAEIMRTPPERFISDILIGRLNASALCCGFNYRFGMHAAGNVRLLQEKGSEYGIKVCVHDAVMIHGEVVSSTSIRKALVRGDMEKCTMLLGRPYSVTGRISHNKNISPQDACFDTDDVLLPPDGLYVSVTELEDKIFDSFSTISTEFRNGKCVRRITTPLPLPYEEPDNGLFKINLLLILRILKIGISPEIMPLRVFENDFSSFQAVC